MGRKGKAILVLLLLTANIFTTGAQEEDAIYDEAILQYSGNNFSEALSGFERLMANGYSSFNLYYNAGNAAFKTGNIPGSILYYEKALLLKPFSEDARYNLEIARTYTIDNLEVIPELFFVRWVKLFSLIIDVNSWAILSAVTFLITLIGVSIFLFSVRYRTKKVTLILSLILLLTSLLSLSFSLVNRSMTLRGDQAIVFEPVVTGKSSPGTGGTDLFVIHEGTKVSIEDNIGDWIEVRLSDGSVGWISKEFVQKI
jgi:tetratricopeptide (TPR) repeat protein